MPTYLDANGRTVSHHIAVDASGRVKPGFRKGADVWREGDYLSFDIMHLDAKPRGAVFLTDAPKPYEHKPCVSPSQARQAEILADVARTDAARQIVRDCFVAEQVAATAADRRAGVGSGLTTALRDAHYNSAATPGADAPRLSLADNSQVASALRFARYS